MPDPPPGTPGPPDMHPAWPRSPKGHMMNKLINEHALQKEINGILVHTKYNIMWKLLRGCKNAKQSNRPYIYHLVSVRNKMDALVIII